jgi:hypothetical protein
MFGTPSVSHEWDTIAFGLSTIPGIAALLLVAAGYWEQWRRRPSMPRARDPIAAHRYLHSPDEPRTEYSVARPFVTDFATGADAKEIAA